MHTMPRRKLNPKQNSSVLFSFNATDLYHEYNSPLTVEQLAIASHKVIHENRAALGKQSSLSKSIFLFRRDGLMYVTSTNIKMSF